MTKIALLLAAFTLSTFHAVAQGPLTIANPSFEVDAVAAFPTYRTTITGWSVVGGSKVGVNTTAGPFMDNGTVPDGTKVLFLQQVGAVYQSISGLVAGTTYEVRIRVNARASTDPALLNASMGPSLFSLVPVTSVGGTNAFTLMTATFTASFTGSMDLIIENKKNTPDNTLLVDHIEIVPVVTAAKDWQHLQ